MKLQVQKNVKLRRSDWSQFHFIFGQRDASVTLLLEGIQQWQCVCVCVCLIDFLTCKSIESENDQTVRVRAESVIIGCLFLFECRFVGTAATHCFFPKSIGIRPAKWNNTQWETVRPLRMCAWWWLQLLHQIISIFFFLPTAFFHISMKRIQRQQWKYQMKMIMWMVLFCSRILHHFSFASAHMTCNGNRSSGVFSSSSA